MLGDLQGFQRIAAQGDMALGQERRGTGATEHFLEKAAAATFHSLVLGDAQELAAIKKGRLLVEHAGENGDGVIVIAPI